MEKRDGIPLISESVAKAGSSLIRSRTRVTPDLVARVSLSGNQQYTLADEVSDYISRVCNKKQIVCLINRKKRLFIITYLYNLT